MHFYTYLCTFDDWFEACILTDAIYGQWWPINILIYVARLLALLLNCVLPTVHQSIFKVFVNWTDSWSHSYYLPLRSFIGILGSSAAATQ